MKDAFNKELKVGDVVLYSQSLPGEGIIYSIGEIFKISVDKVSKGAYGQTIPGKISIRIEKSSISQKKNMAVTVLPNKVLLLKSNQKETS